MVSKLSKSQRLGRIAYDAILKQDANTLKELITNGLDINDIDLSGTPVAKNMGNRCLLERYLLLTSVITFQDHNGWLSCRKTSVQNLYGRSERWGLILIKNLRPIRIHQVYPVRLSK